MISEQNYHKYNYFGTREIRDDILSICCSAPVQDIAGCYSDSGDILNGYVCTKCGNHLYKLSHFIDKRK